MSYIHSKNILLHSIISMGIVFSIAKSSTVYCMLDKGGKYDEINENTKTLAQKLRSDIEHTRKYQLFYQESTDDMDTLLSQIPGIDMTKIKSDEKYHYLQKFIQEPTANQGKLTSETQVDEVGKDVIIAHSSKVSESLDAIIKHLDTNPENAANAIVKSFDEYPIVQNHAISGCNLTDAQSKHHSKNIDIKEVQQEIRKIAEGISIPPSLFADNQNDIKVQVVNGDGMPHKSTTSVHNTPAPIYDVPKPIYDTPRNIYPVSANSNESPSIQVKTRKKRSLQYESDIRDSKNEASYVDGSDKHNLDPDDSDIYEDMAVQHNHREAYDVPAGSNDYSSEYNLDPDDNDKEGTGLDSQDDTIAHINSQSDDNKHSRDTNDTTTSPTNTDNNLANHGIDTEWDDNKPNNLIAGNNNQLSNMHNRNGNSSHLRKDFVYGDHAIFLQLFNSANYTALHRISSRLTAYALDQTRNEQFSSQRLVSSGSSISNVQHEIWMMPLIKKGEKYVDNVSKYTISTYGINLGFDSKIPHCRGNIESVLGIVFALYNSQLEHTASDSATLLNTYIISMYYSIIFNQKFFIYTLFSFGTSNAGNYHSATVVNIVYTIQNHLAVIMHLGSLQNYTQVIILCCVIVSYTINRLY